MPTPDQTIIPYRFREKQFRRFEPFIADAIAKFPGPIIVNPGLLNLNQVTFACRFRDACRSYQKHNWPSALINREAFDLYIKDLAVAESATLSTLRIGDRKQLRNAQLLPMPTSVVNSLSPAASCTITITTEEQFQLLCELASQRLLASEITITGPGATLENKHKYEQNYDVSIEFTNDLKYASII